jgi:hypothetical protein
MIIPSARIPKFNATTSRRLGGSEVREVDSRAACRPDIGKKSKYLNWYIALGNTASPTAGSPELECPPPWLSLLPHGEGVDATVKGFVGQGDIDM